MDLDYEDWSHGGGHMHFVPRGPMPFSMYKHTDRFKRNQAAKPMYASRDPQKCELRYWETKHGHVNEVAGKRIYRGACEVCDDVVLEVRDVFGEEFRGKRNAGWRGRWPALCDGCRERGREESLQRRAAAKRKADRERIADKRDTERLNADADRGDRQPDESPLPAGWWRDGIGGYWYRDARGEEQWTSRRPVISD